MLFVKFFLIIALIRLNYMPLEMPSKRDMELVYLSESCP